jgi:VIT1/CCC1 family predicted Fe2+/Mn2+ transporter
LERHFSASDTVRDVIIGMADGLTVPFALAAGLSSAAAATHLIITGGLAEIAAGAIAMGMGGYLAARSDAEHYAAERRREYHEVAATPAAESAEVRGILQSYGLTAEESTPIVTALERRPDGWVDFMMRFELGLERPNPRRALASAATIGGAYIVGGLVPLAPYMLLPAASSALVVSAAVTLTVLGIFGFVKAGFTSSPRLRSAVQSMLLGGLAAAAAFLLARLV